MRLTLVRHGEMAGDPYVTPESPVNGCLTEDIGVSQAKATAEALKDERFDAAFSSPYGRALQTAEIVLAGRGLRIKTLPFMREWEPFEKYRALPDDEWEALLKRNEAVYLEDGWSSEIGENYFEMCARIAPPFLKELDALGVHSRYGGFVPEEAVKDISIILFAHGGSLGVLTDFLLGRKISPVSGFGFAHTG
ncbi:MAG: histidine phosphatase family protein, partial [Defluviitaleaceae bacterium]|nr:histidine phosphatase family protein [Defluviitaleaceae bacterium]